ncbi:DUF4870 domain-containing protein [Pelagibaculum spongiae]|uniref:DUF4870 domain-containing protein n=1 Tax=Pelagibaculum spongiae TaxID=2080658 RepID=A0A2V1H5N3_9GAMM|nr:DUF4870 domain-containing protein [Pelagibaculum spongiae]PVZ71732.1 DUF4870 domain-containing protein [Pelagibaculum spongiae]
MDSNLDTKPQTQDDSRPPTSAASTAEVVVTQDSKNLALLTWLATFFLGFVPGLIIYVFKKDDAYLLDQAKEALNWSITLILAYTIAFALTFVVIGILLIPIVALCHLVFCIMGMVKTHDGAAFRVPWTLRLIK